MLVRELSTIERSETRSLTGHEVTCSTEQSALALALWAKNNVIINTKRNGSVFMSSTYESELQALKEAKKKIEIKYGKIAKKRLAYISKYLSLDTQLISLDDDEFKAWVDNNLSILRQVPVVSDDKEETSAQSSVLDDFPM
ncbi:hypothetical protein [Ligilactobacillus agilis]|uniref:hypothetical protein n=1 Tax=Ligilactobacillus agilis TaxID=1601 RepID=UPI00195EF526|nr:hypothetical protein [Ligilactobacillus agilis]MBM6764248.1 hypothetical protein [Ligilactobacillus agilis]